MLRVRHVALVSVIATLALAACKKAELGDPVPNGISISSDKATITADDGSVTVQAIAYEDGIALLDYPVVFEVTGIASAPVVTVDSDPTTGVATHTFTNLRIATGATASIVHARVGAVGAEISATTPLSIVPGAVASITVAPSNQAVSADVGSLGITVGAVDAFSNGVADAPVILAASAPGATIQGGTIENLRVAGDWILYGTLAGGPAITDTAGIAVLPGAAAQVHSTLGQPVVGQLDALRIDCAEMDAFGNDLTAAGTFAAGEVTTSPASTITAVAGTAGAFTASGFASAGVYTATCSNDGRADSSTFQVAAQASGPSVLATLDKSVVQVGATVSLTCREYDAFGNPTPATFDPGAGEVSTNAPGATVSGAAGNAFTLTNLSAEGAYTATCTKGAASDSDDFAVVDTVDPTVTSFAITNATSHNGALDGRHGQESLTFEISATDAGGLSKVEFGVAQGAAMISSVTPILLAGETAATTTATVQVLSNPTFGQVVVRAQVHDASGNVSTSDVTITFDPGANLTAAGGATVRTVFESSVSGFSQSQALTASNGNLLLLRDTGTGNDELVRAVPGTAGTTTFATVASDFVPGVDSANDVEALASVFGPGSTFVSVFGSNGAISVLGPTSVFATAPLAPADLAFGMVDTTTSLMVLDLGTPATQLNRIDATGAQAPFYDDLADGAIPNATAMTVLGGDVYVVQLAGGITRFPGNNPAAHATVAASGSGRDIVSFGTSLLTVDNTSVSKVAAPGPSTPTQVVSGLAGGLDLGLDFDGTLYVLECSPTCRVYKVTGY